MRVCRDEEKEVLASVRGGGKSEVVSVSLHAFRVRIARDREGCKRRGGKGGREGMEGLRW